MVMELLMVPQQGQEEEEEQQQPDVLPCGIPAAPRSRLAFSWGAGTQLRVVEVLCPGTGAGGRHPHAAICQWGITTGDQRRIAYQIMPLFRSLKRQLLALGPGRLHEAKEARRQYCAAVLDVLTADASDPVLGPPSSDAALQVAYEAALWQLLELFFLRSDAEDGYLAEAFAAWLAQHGGLFNEQPGFDALGAEAVRLSRLPRVDLDPHYWDTIHRLVLLGRLEAALALLTAHPAYQSLDDPSMATKVRALDTVYNVLRVVPRLTSAAADGGGSASSLAQLGAVGVLTDDPVVFGSERAAWQHRVDTLAEQRGELLADLKALDPEAAQGLSVLLRLLCAGSSHAAFADAGFKALAAKAHNWVELLVGSLLWAHPTLPSLELRGLVGKVTRGGLVATRGSDTAFLDFFEQLLVAACGQEVAPIVSLCTNHEYTGLQFVVHAYEVLAALPAAARLIARPLPHLGCDQAESFTLHYVDALLGPAATWGLAVEYLAWCPAHGGDAMEAALDGAQLALESHQEALRALAVAQRHGLTAAGADLARRLSSAAAEAGQLAVALQWALRAHDPALCAELVAPLVGKVQQQLLAQVGSSATAPLELPELEDMEHLLAHMPGPAAAADADADDGFDFMQQLQQPSSAATRQQQHRHHHQQQQQPYPELHFLAVMLQLQQALQAVQRCQQPEERQQQQQQLSGLFGGGGGEAANGSAAADALQDGGEAASAQHKAALGAAYAAVRQPVRRLLLDGLAPAAVRLPLLTYLSPLFDSEHMPFSRAEVQGCMQLLAAGSTGLPSVAAAVLEGSHRSGGVAWPSGIDAGALTAARLALCRGLARAHVAGWDQAGA